MNFNSPPDYQAQAEKCLEWAERATERQTQLHWLQMARAHLSLAAAFAKEVPHPVWGDASLLEFDHSNSLTRH